DAVEIHGDVADVAGEPDSMEWRASAAVRYGEVLRDVRAAEPLRVPAAPSFDHVVAVAGTPQELVVAGAAEQRVVAGGTDEDVAPGAAGQDVVAGAAVELRQRQGAVGLVQGEVVVAQAAVQEDPMRVGDGHPREGAAIHEDRPGRVAGDHDG